MTRVLVLGGGGMLGHKLYQVLRERCDVYASFRRFDDRLRATGVYDATRAIGDVDAEDMASVRRAVSAVEPDWVVNCIGIVKQLDDARNAKLSILVNALFPHLLCEYLGGVGVRVIHVSTDCVFSGKKGAYSEADVSDAEDLYGRTKYLGEVAYDHSLTLRTSIVGRALFADVSLIDWFLSQSGKTVKGYTNAIYTGLSTVELSREIWRIISSYPRLQGLYHVSSARISKYDLLTLVNRAFGVGVTIEPDDSVICDRSLRSDRYTHDTGFVAPTWEDMVAAMARDLTPYARFRQSDR